MKKIISGLLLIIIGLVSCKSNKETTQAAKENHTIIKRPTADVTLASMMRRLPGVHVRGDGTNAIIRIRGGSGSFVSSNEPLFVLNDQIIQGGYSSIASSIDPTEVKTIEVLKDINSLSFYGSRGANGVIKIIMK